MPEIIEQYYAPLLKGHGFIPDPDNQQYGSLGISWKLSPEIGEGSYWTYGQKDLYDIKIHNFSFHEDSLLEFSLPECLSITRYDSISGEELAPYRRLSAGCIKTYIGGYSPYRVLIHKNIPIRSMEIINGSLLFLCPGTGRKENLFIHALNPGNKRNLLQKNSCHFGPH